MGTPFIATQGCRGRVAWKQHLIEAGEGDTAYVMRMLGNPSRVARNPVTEARGTTVEELLPPLGAGSSVAFDDANIADGFAPCGQSVGMIHDRLIGRRIAFNTDRLPVL